MKVLMTGASGFLGAFTRQELDRRGISWQGLSRQGEFGVQGDLTCWDLGVSVESLRRESYTTFLHMGALYDMRAKPSQLFTTNVSGTLNALILAQKLGIKHFVNISSVAVVANCPKSLAGEHELFLDEPFHDAYGESKALSEKLIERWTDRFDSVFNIRLGVLVGDSVSGQMNRVDGPYWIPEAFRKLKQWLQWAPFPVPLPGGSANGAPLVPVDRAAFAIAEVLSKVDQIKGYTSIHGVPENRVDINDLYKDSLSFLGIGHKKYFLINKMPMNMDAKAAEFFTELPQKEVEYLSSFPIFNSLNSLSILPKGWCPDYSEYRDAFWRGYEKFVQNR